MNEVIDKLCEKFGVVVDKTQPYMEDLISRVCDIFCMDYNFYFNDCLSNIYHKTRFR